MRLRLMAIKFLPILMYALKHAFTIAVKSIRGVVPTFSTMLFLLVLLHCFVFNSYSQTNIFPHSTIWKYNDLGTNLGTGWKEPLYNDASWLQGMASFGYGDPVTTCIKPGASCGTDNCSPVPVNCDKTITYYFRKKFTIEDLSEFKDFTMNMLRDDGAIVYVNGIKVWTSNMTTTVIYRTLANKQVDGNAETEMEITRIPSSFFLEGENTIAVELHQFSVNSSDLFFSLELIGNPLSIVRGPYLQMGNQTAVTIRWQTNAAATSKIEIGSGFGTYAIRTISDNILKTDHELRVTGLSPGTRYWYRVSTNDNVLEASPAMNFLTAPPDGETGLIKVAVFGDCGRNDRQFRTGSINSYKKYVGNNPAELLLLLGDNAYPNGTDNEYLNHFFIPMNEPLLKNHIMFPTPGNHDYGEFGRHSKENAYYKNFSMPVNGECGGLPSGSEAYYSFDWGNIHFISLDSYGTEEDLTRLYDTTGEQVSWLKNDLAATSKQWKIVYWHHPPFTKGSHNSDTEEELVLIRERFVRILERYGVDMILCGHSHNYERSYLLRNYYGTEQSFQRALHTADSSSGLYNTATNNCPYTIRTDEGNHGAVYVVSGSAGAEGIMDESFPHDALPFAFDDGGMFYFEVRDNRLDAKFLRYDSTIADQFTILKDVNTKSSVYTSVGQPVLLSASWPGEYNWSETTSTERSITITPNEQGSTEVYVQDHPNNPCLLDTFIVNTSAALPVNLLSFDTKHLNGSVHLSWKTNNELNNHSFLLARSEDGIQFRDIASLPASEALLSGNQKSYRYTDENVPAGEWYYRLRQRDVDGRESLLGTRKLIVDEAANRSGFSVSYLPMGGRGSLKLYSNIKRNMHLTVSDIAGRLLINKQLALQAGTSVQPLEIQPGMYIVRITGSDGASFTKKIIVF